ncbi:MAG: AAA family ATPase [Candidatus Bathyarchaeota archaeon]|nr:AAA family ATPase [Candidatus Bathyarchaeota archaeon]
MEGKLGVFLEKLEISNFRGLSNYTSEGFSKWTSLTGPNSSGKSTIISALSLLGSNRMHDIQDVSAYFKPNRVPLREISIETAYTFRLTSSILDVFSDERVLETLLLSYEDSLRRTSGKQDDFIDKKIKMEIEVIKKKPLKDIMTDALHTAIKTSRNNYGTLTYRDVLDQAKYLCIDMSLSLSDGPRFKFTLLNNEKKEVLLRKNYFMSG